MRVTPLVLGLGAALGASLAAVLGTYVPSWGVALAFPAASIVLSLGVHFAPESDEVPVVLQGAAAIEAAFLLVTLPLTLVGLDDLATPDVRALAPLAARATEQVRAELWPRWIVMAGGLVAGAAGLLYRRRRVRAAAP